MILMLIISALRNLRQEDHELKFRVSYTEKTFLKNPKNTWKYLMCPQ
jgi:hypothetical protein